MKKRTLLAQTLVAAMAISSVAGFSSAPEAAAAAAPKLSAKSLTMTVGQTKSLSVKKVNGIKKIVKVTWKTEKKKVATFKKKNSTTATITAKGKGTTKIKATVKFKRKTAKVNSKTLTCTVKVNPKSPGQTAVTSAAPTAAASPTTASSPTPEPTPTPIPKTNLKDASPDFRIGTVISYDGKNSFQDEKFTAVAKENFNLVSFENEMKGYSLLDGDACKESKDGMPVCTFEQADKMVQWAVDNGMKVRGHVLFWESSMLNSFFYENYDDESEGAKLVDAETLKKRMQSYSKQVITHFEEKFPGTVVAWDIVNEAIDTGIDPDPTTGLRLNRNGNFYKILGGEYIKYAFQYAKDAREEAKKINPNCETLFYYNDYNTFQAPKTSYIVDLIRYLNSDPKNPLLDAMGMEGYVLTYWPSPTEVYSAMVTYQKEDVKIGINELTVRLNRDQSANGAEVTAKDITAHAKKYKDMFTQYCKFNQKYPGVLTNVSIWALTDHPELEAEADKPADERDYDYEIYGTHSGLYTADFEKKTAYDNVLSVLNSYRKEK